MQSETAVLLWVAKLRDTTNRITRRISWIQLCNKVLQLFQSLSGGFLSPGSLVVKEVWGATNDSVFLVAAWCLCKSCRTLLLQDLQFSFTAEVKRHVPGFSDFFLSPVLRARPLVCMCVSLRTKEETDGFIYFTSLFSNVIRWKTKINENPSSNRKAFLEMEMAARTENSCLWGGIKFDMDISNMSAFSQQMW